MGTVDKLACRDAFANAMIDPTKASLIASTSMPLTEQGQEFSRGQVIAMALTLSCVLWLLAWYADTAQSMVELWRSTDTFVHGFAIVPISTWMIWQRRRAVAGLELRPDPRALPILAVIGFGWLLAELAGASVVKHAGLVVMIPLVVWAILGCAAVRTLAFPLLFLLFAVPFGEFLEAPLMEYTADFTVAALKLTGVPVYREGQFFMTPSGSWSVVEACSGLRYLIASLTVGVLYAHVMYRRYWRRALFAALSVAVAIVANWLRAYLIVMVGHLLGMQHAAEFDHLIYGWLFFGVVIVVLLWMGSYWREDPVPHLAPATFPTAAGRRQVPLAAILTATIATAVVAALWPEAAMRLQNPRSYARPLLLAPSASTGWESLPGRLTQWDPRFLSPSTRIHQAYSKNAWRAGLYVGYYRNQSASAQLISSRNALVRGDDAVWKSVGRARRVPLPARADFSLTETRLHTDSAGLLVWHWYWVDGRHVVNPYWAKFLQARSGLLGRGDDGAVVVVYVPYEDQPQSAEQVLRDFVGAMLPEITRTLERARAIRPLSCAPADGPDCPGLRRNRGARLGELARVSYGA